MTEAERIWNRIKLVAAQAAHRGETITIADAEQLVHDIIVEEHAMWSTPSEARLYFAEELRRMVLEAPQP